MFRLFIDLVSASLLRRGDGIGIGGGGGSDWTRVAPTKKKEETQQTESTVSMGSNRTAVETQPKPQEDVTIAPQDQQQITAPSHNVQDGVQGIETTTSSGRLPDLGQMETLRQGAVLLDKFVPPQVQTVIVEDLPQPQQARPVMNPSLQDQIRTRAPEVTGTDSQLQKLKSLDESVSKKQLETPQMVPDRPQVTPSVPRKTPEQTFSNIVSMNLGRSLEKLDHASFFTSKGKIYESAETIGRQMTASITPNSELARSLVFKSDDEIRQVIRDGLSQVDDSKGKSRFSKLSNSEQDKIVDAALAGIKKGLPVSGAAARMERAETPEARQQVIADTRRGMQELIKAAPPFSQQVVSLSAGSEAQRNNAAANALKLPVADLQEAAVAKVLQTWDPQDIQNMLGVNSEKKMKAMLETMSNAQIVDALNLDITKQLPPAQQELVQAVRQGAEAALPMQVSSNMVKVQGSNDPVPESLTIQGKTYNNPEYVTAGGGGRIFVYHDADDPTKMIVLKEPKQNDTNSGALEIDRRGLAREIQSHALVMGEDGKGNKNIAQMLGGTRGTEGQIYMAMEFVKGPDMKEISQSLAELRKTGLISDQDSTLAVQFLGRQTLDGYIHIQDQSDVLHGDTKGENLMYDVPSGRALVIDFGEARRSQDVVQGDQVGTTNYQAPEMLRGEAYDKTVDNFSLGQIFHELGTGTTVLQEDPNAKGKDKKTMTDLTKDFQGKAVQERASAFGDQFSRVINKTYTSSAEQREALSTLRNNPFFSDPLGSDERAQQVMAQVSAMAKVRKGEEKLTEYQSQVNVIESTTPGPEREQKLNQEKARIFFQAEELGLPITGQDTTADVYGKIKGYVDTRTQELSAQRQEVEARLQELQTGGPR